MPRGSKPTDLTGQRFGRLIALQRTATYITGRKPMWLYKCDCGKATLAISLCLVKGTTQSCGCLREEFLTLGPMKVAGLDMQPVVGLLGRVEYRAVDPLRGRADEASGLAVGDPEPYRPVRAALASSRGCEGCFSAGGFQF